MLISRRLSRQVINCPSKRVNFKGDYMGALDAFLDQLDVQGACHLAPGECADQVEPALTTSPRRDAQAVL
jgi:hypothetical protein